MLCGTWVALHRFATRDIRILRGSSNSKCQDLLRVRQTAWSRCDHGGLGSRFWGTISSTFSPEACNFAVCNTHNLMKHTWNAIVAVAILLTGCSSFNREWRAAGREPVPSEGISGQWIGTWQNTNNTHSDTMRAVLKDSGNGTYQAHFHARYKRIFRSPTPWSWRVDERRTVFDSTASRTWGKWRAESTGTTGGLPGRISSRRMTPSTTWEPLPSIVRCVTEFHWQSRNAASVRQS